MAVTRNLERLTASDMFLLLWDDFGWSGDIGALAILDGTSLLDREYCVSIEELRQHLEPRMHPNEAVSHPPRCAITSRRGCCRLQVVPPPATGSTRLRCFLA
jgi:hypothetical protein